MLLILPNQLFQGIEDDREKILWEHPEFFNSKNYHKQKLVLHRASMKKFQDEKGGDYVECDEEISKKLENVEELEVYEPCDHEIRMELEKLSERFSLRLKFLETPMFLNSREYNRKYFSENDYYHRPFYQEQRKRLEILVENNKPVGGKWSFDPENRKPLPEDVETPGIPRFENDYVEEAKNYVEENFPENPGSLENFFWPTTHGEAEKMLEDFLKNRLEKFGDYQDALSQEEPFAFHSLLSSSLNTGLLTPEQVVEKTLEAHEENDYPMNSLEGFLRQIIGWREYIRAIYQLEGEEMKERNYWNNDREVPEKFYEGETGVEPLDLTLNRVEENAYAHHIERLMVLGNFMLLCEFDPGEVLEWFSERFIDAYEWVMVPNVLGMSQYADPRIMTKPYISSSNYIDKMSDFDSGEWEETWDGLYWSFMEKHREKIEEISRMSVMTSHLDRMEEETLKEHRERKEEFLESFE